MINNFAIFCCYPRSSHRFSHGFRLEGDLHLHVLVRIQVARPRPREFWWADVQRNRWFVVSELRIWLVLSTPLKNISQLGWWHSLYIWENKKCSKPPTRNKLGCSVDHCKENTCVYYMLLPTYCVYCTQLLLQLPCGFSETSLNIQYLGLFTGHLLKVWNRILPRFLTSSKHVTGSVFFANFGFQPQPGIPGVSGQIQNLGGGPRILN